MRPLAYNPALDGLRALAVVAVVADHAGFRLAGNDGVIVFFAISGYLITALLLRERERTGRIDLRAFYRRRWARLTPALALVLAVTAGWVLLLGLPARRWLLGLFAAASYTTDFVEGAGGKPHVSSYFEYSWSLGVEEQFYLIWPLLILGLVAVHRRLARWTVGACCVLLAAASVLDRMALVAAHASSERVNFALDTNVAPIAAGALLAVVTAGAVPAWVRRAAAAIGTAALGCLVVLAFRPAWPPSWRFDVHRFGLLPLLATLALAGAVLAPRQGVARVTASRPLAHVGRLSYGLYLWNMLLMDGFAEIFGSRPAVAGWAGVAWVGTLVAVAEVSYRFVEVPLRRRWAHRRDSEVPVAPVPEPVAV